MWILFFLCLFSILQAKITALYLSVPSDPSTSMIIQWHTTPDQMDSAIAFGAPDTAWKTVLGACTEDHSMLIHRVFLEHLIPDTEYSFRIGALHKIYHFRTAPLDFNASFSASIYAPENPFPSTAQAIVKHIKNRGEDLFSKDSFFYFPPYPPTTPPDTSGIAPYPFQEEDPIRESCEKTRAAFQRIYTPLLIPDPLSAHAQTAGSGNEAKNLIHADYGGIEEQDLFDAYHKQFVSIAAQAIQSIRDPKDFSLYAALHAIATLKLKMSVETGTNDPLQLGKWRAKGPNDCFYEDDPYKYLVLSAMTPISLNSRYHRYYLRMKAMLPKETRVIYMRGNIDGTEIRLSGIWGNVIEHTSAIHTVAIIDHAEKTLRKLLEQPPPSRSAWLRDLAKIHWWLAHLMPFYRGSASCTEILIQALVVAKSYAPPRLAGFPLDDKENGLLFADLEAMCLSLNQFVDQYEAMTDRF